MPVVAPPDGVPLDLVDHGRDGLLYDPADPSSLRRAVARLVGDVELRRSLATAGLATVGGRTWTSVVDELIDVHYAAVVRPGRPVLAA